MTLLALYFGALLPYQKARGYITVARGIADYDTFSALKADYDKLFEHNSPVGGEEVVKFFANDILNIVSQGHVPEEVAVALTEYTESQIDKNKNNVTHLLTMGYIYSVMRQRFGNDPYFERAEGYFLRVNEIGPMIPQGLYGLLELYVRSNRLDKARDIGERILEIWPTDNRVQAILNSL